MCVYYNSRKDCALIFTNVNLQHGWSKQKFRSITYCVSDSLNLLK